MLKTPRGVERTGIELQPLGKHCQIETRESFACWVPSVIERAPHEFTNF